MLLIQHTSQKKMWQHDTSLSLQAKGLMLVLTTQFNNGSTIDRRELLSYFTNSDSSFRSAQEQLRLHDYFRLSKVCSDDGRVSTWVWEVFDEPTGERLNIEAVLNLDGKQCPIKMNVIEA